MKRLPTTQLIGGIIHACGNVEFFLNNIIALLTSDEILCERVLALPLEKRIDLAQTLLQKRQPHFEEKKIAHLVDAMKALAKERNILAHNPIVERPDVDDFMVLFVRRGEMSEYGEKVLMRIYSLAWRTSKELWEVFKDVRPVPNSVHKEGSAFSKK